MPRKTFCAVQYIHHWTFDKKKCRFKLFESCLGHYMAKKNQNSNVVLQSSTVLAFVKLQANERNNSQVVYKRMQHLPTMLVPAVHCGKDVTHKTLETMCNVHASPQQCWKSCANRSIVAPCLGVHRTKEMLGVFSVKV